MASPAGNRRLHSAVAILATALSLTTTANAAEISPPVDLGQCAWSRYGSTHPLSLMPRTCPLPMDSRIVDASPAWSAASGTPPPWAPWSYPPWCPDMDASSPSSSSNAPLNRHRASTRPCLYTSTTFRGGHGLSLFAVPSAAASVAAALDDGLVPLAAREHASSSQNSEWANVAYVPYTIAELPGRGKGVVARRRIAKWDVVLVDSPALVAPADFLERFTVARRREVLQRAIDQLPSHQRVEIERELAATGDGERIFDVLKTNIFNVDIAGVSHIGLFPLGARINHACKPNALWRYSPQSMTMEMVALKTIEPGEEVVHSYAPLGGKSDERNHMLKAWGFNCTCSLCTAKRSDVMVSDTRRERLYEVHKALVEEYSFSKAEVNDLARELKLLVEMEELDPQMVSYYEVISRAYLQIGMLNSADKYAERAEKEWIKYGGVEHENVDGIRELWADLKEARRKEEARKARLRKKGKSK